MLMPTHSAEMIACGTIIYLIIFAILRFILKRQSRRPLNSGRIVSSPMLQPGMASEYRPVTEGIALVVAGWRLTLSDVHFVPGIALFTGR
jgi:hypothetical protein